MEIRERVSNERVERKVKLMDKVKALPKTETYKSRKEYQKNNKDDLRHQDIINLIDDFLVVALHMKEEKEKGEIMSLNMYCGIHGHCIMTKKGILEITGCYDEGKLLPFLTDNNGESFSLRQRNALQDIHESIYEKNIDEKALVGTIEGIDMWWNS